MLTIYADSSPPPFWVPSNAITAFWIDVRNIDVYFNKVSLKLEPSWAHTIDHMPVDSDIAEIMGYYIYNIDKLGNVLPSYYEFRVTNSEYGR